MNLAIFCAFLIFLDALQKVISNIQPIFECQSIVISDMQSSLLLVIYTNPRSCFCLLIECLKNIPGLDQMWQTLGTGYSS